MALLDSNLPFNSEVDAGTISTNTPTMHLLVTSLLEEQFNLKVHLSLASPLKSPISARSGMVTIAIQTLTGDKIKSTNSFSFAGPTSYREE